MFCKNCGKELPDSAKFCANCGTPVTPPAPPEQPAPSSDPIQFPGAGFPGDEIPAPKPPVFNDPAPEEETPASEAPAAESEAPAPEAPAAESEPPAPEAPAAEPEAPKPQPSEAPYESAAPLPDFSGTASAAEQPTKRRGKAGLVVLGVGAVVVILLVVLLVKLFSGLGGGSGKAMYAYRNDDGELMYLADLKEKTEALELTDEASYASDVVFSADGKTVYFTDADSTLYSITVSELKKGGKAERISRDVTSFRMLKDGRLAFVKSSSSGGMELNILEKGDTYRLLKDYYQLRYSEDQKTVYYTERDDSDDTYALYRISIAKDAKEERLLKGATSIYTSYDSSVLVYGVDDNPYGSGYASADTADNNTLAVYSCTPGGDKTKLIDDIYSVSGVKVDGSKVSFYYYVQDVEERTLYDFVTDSNASSDASILSGDRPVSPSWYDYSPRDYGIVDDYTVEYYDSTGSRYTIDVSSLIDADLPTAYEVYMNTWSVETIADEECRARYNEARDDYDARIDGWNEAQSRENIRQSLKDSQYNQPSFSLYQYTGSDKSDPIATGISGSSRADSADNGIFLYHKVSDTGGKVADVDELDYAGQVRDMLNSGESDDDWYQNVGGKESVLNDLEDVTYIYSVYVLNGKEVVLDVNEDGDNILQAYSLGKDSLTFTSTIVDDDFSGPYMGASSGKDVLYVFTDVDYDSDGTVGDFCVYKDGKLETVAKEIYGALILDNDGATYAVTDLDSRRGTIEFALLKDGKSTTISDEISGTIDPIFLDSTQFLYISDGDLMLWNGKEERRIARDVLEVWASTQADYSTYSAN